MRPWKRALLIAGGVLSLGVGLTAAFSPAFREELRLLIVVPFLQAYYVVRFYLDRLPQLLLWLVPLCVLAVLTVRAVLRPVHVPRRRRRWIDPPWREGELLVLGRRIHTARISRFGRMRVSRRAAGIAMRLIASHRGASLEEARASLRRKDWCDDKAVASFLQPHAHSGRLGEGKDFQRRLDRVVSYLEQYHQEV